MLCDFGTVFDVHTEVLGGTPCDTITYDPDTVCPTPGEDAIEAMVIGLWSADLVSTECRDDHDMAIVASKMVLGK